MLMAIIYSSNGFEKMDVPVPYLDRSGCLPAEFMKMVVIEIRTESHFMKMVLPPTLYRLSGYGCKSMVMRIFFALCYFNAALYLVNMFLLIMTAIIII